MSTVTDFTELLPYAARSMHGGQTVGVHGSLTTKSIGRDKGKESHGSSVNLFTRKVWLPKPIYGAIPYLYLVVGSLALAATIYIHHWTWIVPHYLLFSVFCLHMGIVVIRRRKRARRDDR